MESKRQLAAIMFTDIAGYTALMDENEQHALSLLRRNRDLQKPIIDAYDGRWLKEMGDGVLALFSTVSDAVQAAIAIQNACENELELKLRIGIHQGEVLFEGNDVFGSGVNIASRLESLAPAGGIFMSEMVARDVDNKGINATFIGEKRLKNVKYPVRIYQLLGDNIGARQVMPQPKKKDDKSIAVLPFINLSSDTEQEYFSDGLTEELITDLSQIEVLRVISRSSVVRFKATELAISHVARELGVNYILEGSVRKSKNSLRINVRLIDAKEDRNIWSGKYSGLLDDIFDIQEQVSQSVVRALRIRLNPSEKRKLSDKPIRDARAYELYQKAQFEIFRFNEDGLKRALRYLKEALKFEGENPVIYGKIGITYCNLINVSSKIDPDYFRKARELAKKVFALEPDNPMGFTILGHIEFYDGYITDAVNQIRAAWFGNPSNPDNLILLILGHSYLGQSSHADIYCKKMGEVDPYNPVYHALLALRHYMGGDLDRAIEEINKGYKMYPEIPQVQLYYAYYLATSGHHSEALDVLKKYIINTEGSIFSSMGLLFKCALEGRYTDGILSPEVEEKLKIDVEWSWLIADFYSMLNQKEKAIDWLEHVIDRGFINYPLFTDYDPFLKNIREENRFRQLMDKVHPLYEHEAK